MKISQAEMICSEYGSVLQHALEGGDVAFCLSRLPAPPQRILQAMKLALANDIHSGSLIKDTLNNFGGAARFLKCFVSDNEAQRLDHNYRNFKASDITRLSPDEFRKQSQLKGEAFNWKTSALVNGMTLCSELEAFTESVQQFDRKDPLFWQRVYTLAGLEYSAPSNPTTKKRSFWGWFS